jgi:hypothetical protein
MNETRRVVEAPAKSDRGSGGNGLFHPVFRFKPGL